MWPKQVQTVLSIAWLVLMSNRKKVIRNLSVIILLFCFRVGMAHQPDLSSLMIYEQNGKSILLIKSSLTAFEQEIIYLYGKDSYKTPQEFQQLVIKYFQQNCSVSINGETIKFVTPKVMLGHETTVFAELSNCPKTIKSLVVKNDVFKDMPNNVCEVILTFNGLAQKQFVLGNALGHHAKLFVENGNWIIEEVSSDFYQKPAFIFLALFTIIASLVIIRGVIKFVSSASSKYLFLQKR